MPFWIRAYIFTLFSNSIVPDLAKWACWAKALLPVRKNSPIDIMIVFFMMLFFWCSPCHFAKVIGNSEHKISFQSCIAVLGDQVGACIPAEPYILVEQVV